MTAALKVLGQANRLMERPAAATAGLWPRAVALLARQALEMTLRDLWLAKAESVARCSTRAQLLCLPMFVSPETAKNATLAWHILSEACHYHPYELQPTSGELLYALQLVERVAEALKSLEQ